MTRKDAALRARIEFGNPNAHKDRCRQSRSIPLLDDLTADPRFTLRNVRKHVVLSSAVVATLTLGIGTSSAVFTFVNADVLRPRVETDPGSFVRVYASYTTDLTKRGPFGGVSLEDYIAMRDGSRSLHDVAARSQTFAPVEHDDPTPVRALPVTCNSFRIVDSTERRSTDSPPVFLHEKTMIRTVSSRPLRR
jgi:hypothetical protein